MMARSKSTILIALGVALLTIAAVGAGSASATVLCNEELVECLSANTYPAGTAIKATLDKSTSAELKSASGTIKCAESSLTATTTAKEAEPLPASLSVLSFGKCLLLGFISCTAEAKNLPFAASIKYTGSGDGTLTVGKGEGGEPQLFVKCGAFLTCTYTASSLTMSIEGGGPAALKAKGAGLAGSGEACPEEAKEATLTASYNTGEQPPILPSAANTPATVLCQQDVSPCPQTYPVPTTFKGALEAEVKFSFVYGGAAKAPVCKVFDIEGKTTTNGSPLVGELTAVLIDECGGGLCKIEMLRLPYRVKLLAGTPGTMTWESKTNGRPVFRISACPGVMECFYGADTVPFKVTGGGPAKFVNTAGVALGLEAGLSDAACSANATWEGVAGVGGEIKFKFTAPSPLYLRS